MSIIVPTVIYDNYEYLSIYRYAKGLDPDNWLTIDPLTAEIKLNKMPDRESPYLVNGTYIAKVLCITDGTFLYSQRYFWVQTIFIARILAHFG